MSGRAQGALDQRCPFILACGSVSDISPMFPLGGLSHPPHVSCKNAQAPFVSQLLLLTLRTSFRAAPVLNL